MKKHLHNSLRALFLSLAVLLSLPMLAEQVEIDGINYDLNADAKQATVIKKSSDKYTGEVVIPESVAYNGYTYSVMGIGENAFSLCSGLTSVTIPNSVTSIGSYAFSSCSGLTSVHITDIAAWCNIDFSHNSSNPLDYANHLYLNGEEVKDLVIPNSVTSIRDYAFYGCSGLTSVTIPNSVTSIGNRAFLGCSGLTSVTIGNGVTSIGNSAFYSCHFVKENFVNNSLLSAEENNYWGAKLHDYETEEGLLIDSTSVVYCRGNAEIVTIPNSVTSIGSYAFSSCSGLTSVTIGNSVTSIGDYAFRSCDGLTSVTIPNSVTSIGESTFEECHFVKENFVNNSSLSAEENNYWGAKLHDYETEEGLLIDSTSVVYCRRNAEIVTIPNSVTSIGEDAFYGCDGLTSVTIPNSVTSIGSYAFGSCI